MTMTALQLDMIRARVDALNGIDVWADGDEIGDQVREDFAELLYELDRLRKAEAPESAGRPGRHTGGRWHFHAGDPKYPGQGGTIIVQKSRIVARIDRGSNPKEQAEMEANGRRIVACVNACEAIPTEELEALVTNANTHPARLASLSLIAEQAMKREDIHR